jgi:hypothetical protein
MREPIDPRAAADADLDLRWWTYGLLVFYCASLLVFCGLVAAQEYYPAPRILAAAAAPPHPAPFKTANLAQGGPATRTVCYEVLD